MRKSLGFAIAFLLAGGASALGEAPPERVIFLLLDTLRADHLHYMGYPRETSPHLDKIAAASVDFRFAIAHGDGTVYSMPSIFTGKYYTQLFSEFAPEGGIPEQHTTLPELFQAGGFRTVGWSTNPNVSKRTHYDQGFDTFHELWSPGSVYARIEHVIRKVRRTYRPSGGKEFLYVQLMDIHSPYFPPAPYHKMWSGPYDRGEFKNGRMTGVDEKESFGVHPYWAETHNIQRVDIAYAVSQYDGEIRYLDAYLQDLFEALHYNPDKDLLIITSDHGEQFYENQFLGHNKSTLLGEIHVPLLVRHPSFAPRKVETPVGLADLVPTLCEVFGFETPAGVQGRSLAGALRGGPLSPAPIFSEGSPARGAVGVAIDDGLLYFLNARHDLWLRPWRLWPIQQQLYDLARDPDCVNDLALARPADLERMNANLRTLNPRFAFATPERLGVRREIAYGAGLIAPGDEEVSVDASHPVSTVALEAKGGSVFVLQFSYTLAEGALRIDLQNAKGTGKPYEYTFFKQRDAPRAFQVVIRPNFDTSALEFKLIGAGPAVISDLRCRPLLVPEIPLGRFDGAGNALEQERELSEEMLEQFRAIGYVF